jgi:hypothetical protein
MKSILAIVPLVLVLTGCTATVHDKYHIPEFSKGHQECFTTGRYGCIEGKDLEIKVPECWRLVIEEGIDVTKICVSKDTWEKTQIGQEWTDETYPI